MGNPGDLIGLRPPAPRQFPQNASHLRIEIRLVCLVVLESHGRQPKLSDATQDIPDLLEAMPGTVHEHGHRHPTIGVLGQRTQTLHRTTIWSFTREPNPT
ncbi:MAG: hypothetical protein N2379_03445, partial [Verrucomicrobiae bacterium]|nr:hypothetical protein [Verrucomicrobiae bacterium]